MVRLIKRYESRKLYDTEESRYVSLEEIADFVRAGQEVKVIDNATSEDATAQTLTQIMLEEGRAGRSQVPTAVLHELVRMGEKALSSGVEQVQQGVDRLMQASIDRLAPIRRAREEMEVLRGRLEQLERSLADLGPVDRAAPRAGNGKSRKRRVIVRKAAKKSAAGKRSAKRAAKPAPKKKTVKAAKRTARKPAAGK